MSHVEDGTLHAYLDGELSALETVRLEAHVSECDACRGRLSDQRRLVTQASEILAAAVPADRPAPPLEGLAPRRGRRGYWPLSAAAVAILALAVGWFVRGELRLGDAPQQTAPSANQRESRAPIAADDEAKATDQSGETPAETRAVEEPPPAATPAPEPPPEQAPVPEARATPREPERIRQSNTPTAPAEPEPAPLPRARDAAPSPPPVSGAPAPSSGETPSAAEAAPGAGAERTSDVVDEPRTLTVAAARGLLYAEVLGVPGLPVVGVRCNCTTSYNAT